MDSAIKFTKISRSHPPIRDLLSAMKQNRLNVEKLISGVMSEAYNKIEELGEYVLSLKGGEGKVKNLCRRITKEWRDTSNIEKGYKPPP
jgi:3-deoxy-D-manno-octulosonate 8-phosphate phosphatase KdsC-like HAD superfamily phosphatase